MATTTSQPLPSDLLGSERERARKRVRLLARVLDQSLRIPGTRFNIGFDGILGLLPGVGDSAGAVLALWLVYEARKLGAPNHVIARMLGNVALDTLLGALPFAGDLFDIFFKASSRNLALLQRYTGEPYIEGRPNK